MKGGYFVIIRILLEQKNMSVYKLAKSSGVPQPTLSDIYSGKAKLEDCKAITLYKIAKALGTSVDLLISASVEHRPNFEIFKSHVCHKVKNDGDMGFIINTLESNEIRSLYQKQWQIESLYLLAMLDYISRENDIQLCTNYNDLRRVRLKETVFPTGVHVRCIVSGDDFPKRESINGAIPEFMRHNIVESEVRNVC
jgi:transcriptional regulator with XRE-family HTH domain